MNDLKIFTNEQFGSVRTVEVNGEPWLVGKDVAEALQYKETAKAIREHVDEEDRGVSILDTPGGKQEMTIINESGFISMVLSSKMPKAKEYKHWVTSEVLPSIRKTGMYMTGSALAYALANPKNALELLSNYVKAQETIEIMAPKAEYFDELVDRKLLTNFRDTAKELGMPERKFTDLLIEKGYIYRDKHKKLKPIAKKNEGLFEIKDCYSEKSKWAGNQTMITPRGKVVFGMLVKKWKDE